MKAKTWNYVMTVEELDQLTLQLYKAARRIRVLGAYADREQTEEGAIIMEECDDAADMIEAVRNEICNLSKAA
jgi:hypothetical protein